MRVRCRKSAAAGAFDGDYGNSTERLARRDRGLMGCFVHRIYRFQRKGICLNATFVSKCDPTKGPMEHKSIAVAGARGRRPTQGSGAGGMERLRPITLGVGRQ
jgi:hypothetical protein